MYIRVLESYIILLVLNHVTCTNYSQTDLCILISLLSCSHYFRSSAPIQTLVNIESLSHHGCRIPNLAWNQGGGTFLGNLAVCLDILLCNSQARRLNTTLPRNCLRHLQNPLCCGIGGREYCLRLSPCPVHLVYLCPLWFQYHCTPLPMWNICTRLP